MGKNQINNDSRDDKSVGGAVDNTADLFAASEGDASLLTLRGQLERITFHNEENGYVVAKVKVDGREDLVTIVGNIPSLTPGEIFNMTGNWITHPRFGEQFKVSSYTTSVPASIAGIIKYLGSGLIKGIGPSMARRIVAKFGDQTLNIIENDIDRLGEISGLGRGRIEMIGRAWKERKEVHSVMLFLQSNGVSTGYATKIFKQYGNQAIQIVTENPYRLAYDISGIGFLTADQIAQRLGFETNSIQRAEAGILYVLYKLSDDGGHTYYPLEALLNETSTLLGTDKEILKEAIDSLENVQKIMVDEFEIDDAEASTVEKIQDEQQTENDSEVSDALQEEKEEEAVRTEKVVFLSGYYIAEKQIAKNLNLIKTSQRRISGINPTEALAFIENHLSISLAGRQKDAIKASVGNKVSVITGQPGTGKTTITRAILQIFSSFSAKILLAAPTGRAAKRMSEATGREAKTIHRLLEYNVSTGRFQRNEQYQLDCDLMIVDESSMIDTLLMYHLLKAIPQFATVIFIGDINQLPSVGAGSVLKDLIDSRVFAVTELNEIFRQSRKSHIILNAQRINEGMFPYIDNTKGSDFYFIEEDDLDMTLDKIVHMVKDRIPKSFGYDSVTDIQVLSPMNKGIVGTIGLNEALQDALNPGSFEVVVGARKFRLADKVMQIKNDYDKDVFNGDIGFVSSINSEEREIVVNIDGREITYDYSEFDELVLAYAISIHKSQGSEYPAVVIPLTTAHYVMLARNLIYTGITRGKKLVVLVGSKRALFIAIKNNKTTKRFTRLKERLRELSGGIRAGEELAAEGSF